MYQHYLLSLCRPGESQVATFVETRGTILSKLQRSRARFTAPRTNAPARLSREELRVAFFLVQLLFPSTTNSPLRRYFRPASLAQTVKIIRSAIVRRGEGLKSAIAASSRIGVSRNRWKKSLLSRNGRQDRVEE